MSQAFVDKRTKSLAVQGYHTATDAGKQVRIDANEVERGYDGFLKRKGLARPANVWRRGKR